MHGFQVEQQRLKLFTDLQAQSKALEKARQEADRSSRVKSEFLTNMSHELRTPMNSIMGFTRRLLKKLGSTLPERELDALQTVDRNAKHLLTLINNILDLSKIEAGKVEVHRTHFDLGTVIREAADQTASLVDGKPVEVKLDLPDDAVPIAADRVMLAQVVVNLLSNGIKFTERGTVTIALDVAHDERLGPVARIAVRDTGVGIKPEDRSRLFQEFTQLDTGGAGRAGGTGLGLVISARFVQLHGGRIDVAGEYGKGSEFTVLLPLSGHNVSEPRTPDLANGAPKTNGSTASHAVPANLLEVRQRGHAAGRKRPRQRRRRARPHPSLAARAPRFSALMTSRTSSSFFSSHSKTSATRSSWRPITTRLSRPPAAGSPT